MVNPEMRVQSVMKQPSAFVPLTMSLIAIALVIGSMFGDLATHGSVVREADEGAVAHLWQLLMAGQVPVVAFFAIKWLPRAPGQTLCVLALQTGAAIWQQIGKPSGSADR